jgi:endoglucanase
MKRKSRIVKMFTLFMALVMAAFVAVACDGGGSEGCDPNPTPSPTPAPTPAPTPGPNPTPTGACQVDYVKNQWNNGFTCDVSVKNTSGQSINGWNLTWTFANGQQIGNSWNAQVSQSGSRVTAANYNNNATIAAYGGQVLFGFQASHTGTNNTPNDFKLNGVACSVGAGPGPDPTPNPSPTPNPTPAADVTFRVNSAGKITKNGQVLPIHCGAWFGLEGQFEPKTSDHNPGGAPMELYMGNMWWDSTGRTIQQDMTEIKQQGINIIRLPIAPQTLDPTDPQGMTYIKNPDGSQNPNGKLKNDPSVGQKNARQALEDFIKLADQNGLQVIVDIHSCSNYVGWRAGRLDAKPPYADANRDNYEYTREEYSCADYTEAKWLNDLKTIANFPKALGVNNILAIDIFNEPWDYTWTEWKKLAEDAYAAINSVNKDVLIMVEGIGSGLQDGTPVPFGNENYNPNWGENFYGAQSAPLNIPKERLIISPHTYGPSVFVQKQFMDPADPKCYGLEGDAAGDAKCDVVIDPAKLRAGWEEHFGFLRDQGYAVVLGEFGGNMNWPQGASEQRDRDRWGYIDYTPDKDWQNALVDYMIDEDIEGCYWSINPESGDTGGLYIHAYDPVSKQGWGRWNGFDTEKINLLKRLWNN